MGYDKRHMPVVPAAAGYERVATTYDRDLDDYDAIDKRAFVRALPAELEGLVALDAGGGTGRWAVRLAKRGADVTLADPSPAMLQIGAAKDGRIHTVVAPDEELPFPDATFDIIVCAFVLGYCPDLDAAVRELARVAKPNALLLLSNSSERKSPIHRVGNSDPFILDVTLYHPSALTQALEKHDCTISSLEVVRTEKGVRSGTVIVAHAPR